MKSVMIRGWEINYGRASAEHFDFIGIAFKELNGGWAFHFGIGHVFVVYIAWYK